MENKTVTYEPQYGNAREIVKYTERENIKEQTLKTNETIKYPLKDKYELGNHYFNDIELIYEIKGIKIFETKSKNIIKPNFIPSVLTRYGIPYNELLDSCKYSITNEGLLKNDKFYFKNFTVHRDYKYPLAELN